MKKIILATLLIPFLFTSCKKKEAECSEPETIYFNIEENVQIGWPLKMYYESPYSETIEITFPNGEIKKLTPSEYINNSYYILTDSATAEHSGHYKGAIRNGSCIQKNGVDDVQILPISNPSCTVPDNTGTSSIGGVGDETYTFVYKHSTGSVNVINGEVGNAQISFAFNGTTPPKPGLYSTYTGHGYYPLTDDPKEVAVTVTKWVNAFYIKGNEKVFVNYVNGNIEVTMCSAEFTNAVSSTPLFISTKLVVSQ
ncbi:MAG: hypothetical protein WC044_04510 [Crocinitomicaceae bacterium]